MDLRRLGAGEWLMGVGGIALLVSLFLPWYDGEGVSCSAGGTDCGPAQLSAWDTLAVTDILLALIAAFALLVWIVTATQRVPALPLALDGLLSIAAFFGVLLVLFRVLSVPGEADRPCLGALARPCRGARHPRRLLAGDGRRTPLHAGSHDRHRRRPDRPATAARADPGAPGRRSLNR